MPVDVESLTAEQRLALAGAWGMMKVAEADITSPVEYYDLALPAGYSQFCLQWLGVAISDNNDTLNCAVSFDGGTSFVFNNTDYDAYMGLFDQCSIILSPYAANNPIANGGLDSLAYLTAGVGAFDGRACIMPGTASLPFRLWADGSSVDSVNGHIYRYNLMGQINPAATVTPPSGRANLMRLLPYGEGDVPPSSEKTFTGQFILFGMP